MAHDSEPPIAPGDDEPFELEDELVARALGPFETCLPAEDLDWLRCLGLVMATSHEAITPLIVRERQERQRLESEIQVKRDPAGLMPPAKRAPKAGHGGRGQ